MSTPPSASHQVAFTATRSASDLPVREARLYAMPVLSALLGLLLIAGVLNYTILTWQHRVALDSERGSSVAALAETRVDEALAGITTALNLIANRAAWEGDGAQGLTRAVRSGGRVGSVSLVDAAGRIERSTVERNIGLRLAPDEFGGGWATARFGFGSLFQGRDLFDRRLAPPGSADFSTVSVPATDGNGFAVATISLRALQVSLTGFLTGADSLAIALYWRDGSLLTSVGRNSVPLVLPPDTLRTIMETDAFIQPGTAVGFTETSLLSCRSSRADPFIVCTRLIAGSILQEWEGWRGVAFAVLLLAVLTTVAGAIRISAEQRRRAREREILRLDIERSERRQRVALASTSGIVWEWDSTLGVIRYFGDTARVFGAGAPSSETCDAFLLRLHPEYRTTFTAALEHLRDPGAPELSVLVQRDSERAIWLRISGRRALNAPGPGRTIGLIGTIADVTALLETSERYRAIFREVAQPILLLNEAGIIEEANPAAEAAFGHTLGSFAGRDVGDLIGRLSSSGSIRATLSEVAGAASALIGLRADGSSFPIAAAIGVWVLDGQARSIAILRDLSADKEIENRLRAAKAASDEAAQTKTDFLSTMSHEIRTPLNGVIGTAGLLAATALDPTQSHYVTILQDSADHLLQLINDILDLSKLDATRIELEEAPFDVAEQLTATLDVLASRALAKAISLKSEIDPAVPPRLRGDISRIRQILLNLIGNANKFTPSGAVTVEVGPGADNTIRFAVRDTGIDIPADQIGRLFGNFVQLDGSIARRFGGTGLGLAISHRLAERMGGRIEVTSQTGIGSIFCLVLPLPAAAEPEPEPEPGTVVSAGPAAGRLSILVAEDNPTNQLVARSMLEAMGHMVQVVGDGEEAVDAVLSRDLDVVLMDVMMPRMDGRAATRAIRAMPVFAALPIIAVTAGAFAHDIDACMESGMSGFVAKPFNRRALQTALAEAVAWRVRRQTAGTVAAH